MSLQDFKQLHPDLYREAYAKGVKSEKRRQYRLKHEAKIRTDVEAWWMEKMRRGEV